MAKLVAKLLGVGSYHARPTKALGALIASKIGYGAWRPKRIYGGVRIGELNHPGPNQRKAALSVEYRRRLKTVWALSVVTLGPSTSGDRLHGVAESAPPTMYLQAS